MPKNNILQIPYVWKEPKAEALWRSNCALRYCKKMFIRTLLITVIFETVFYFLLRPLPFKEVGFNLSKALLIVLIFAIFISTYAYIIGPYLFRFNRLLYTINEKGIRIQNRLFLWKNIIKCNQIESHENVDDVICINFYTKRFPDIPRELVFGMSESHFAEKAYKYIQDKLSFQIQPPTKPRIKLNIYQHIFMTAFSVLGASLFVYFVMPEIKFINDDFEPLIFFVSVLLLGPGPGECSLCII
ncbi:MAG: hypothetical protein A2Y10_08230 [Planctomycetes bacterium GWF2_41_51]|nr:MAG: hypothetical protein A2Y10_08230 [Planctomycetes bacterium GWF2_41_51]HBG26147.1 hypothetical protein [Phycisphaerales bacterium]